MLPPLSFLGRRSQVVRQRSAKPLFIGSIPIAASKAQGRLSRLLFFNDGPVRFLFGNRQNLTGQLSKLREISALIKAQTPIMDGEIVALDHAGKTTIRRAAVTR